MTHDISRRTFLKQLGAGAACAAMATTLPARFAFAAAPGNKRLLVVILRGAMDGLAAVVPFGDKAYADIRGSMALPQDAETLINLDGFFALHHSLKPLATMFAQKELIILHAVATPYRERSHFDAQDLLENGSDTPRSLSTGWLNRAIATMGTPPEALAVGSAVPLMLRGSAKVASWAPSMLPEADEDFLTRVMRMYERDPLLMNALVSAQEMRRMDSGGGMGGARGPRAFIAMMKKAASFMNAASGARIGTVETGGWDTHANQGLGTGKLTNNFDILAQGLEAYREGMGAAWKDTAVLVVTEFGRTVKGNGTGGTDHGTASAAFLLGGSVNGGRIVGDWPGLSKLYQDRDLMPANDLRALLKGTLHQHLGIAPAQLEASIFPGSWGAGEFGGLFRGA